MAHPGVTQNKNTINKGSSVGAAVDIHHTLSCATAHPYDDRIPGSDTWIDSAEIQAYHAVQLDSRLSFGRTFL